MTPDAATAPAPALHDSGDGPALVLLHAFPQDASMWDHQVAALSGRARCLRPDAYGCGVSPPPPQGLTMESWAAAVLDALDAAGAGRVAVAGLSMGGYLAFEILRAAPARVTGLALISTRAQTDGEDTRRSRLEMVAQLSAQGAPARDAQVEPTVARLLSAEAQHEFHISDPVRGRTRRCTPAGLAACQDAMAGRRDNSDLLGAIRVPTLVVAGSDDIVISPDELRTMSSAIDGAGFELVSGAGHLVNLEQPAAVAAMLSAWLDAVAAVR